MMKELESLKFIAESQLIELHNSLRDEREQKHIYKQQLDHRIQQVHIRLNRIDSLFINVLCVHRNLFEILIHYV